jgi:hypothetical protein
MMAVGVWLNGAFLNWFSGDRLSFAGRSTILLAASIASGVISTIALLLGIWPPVCACFIAFIFMGLFACWILVRVSKAITAISKRRNRAR